MQKSQKIVDRALDLHLGENKRKSALKWSCFNIILLSILTFDLSATNYDNDLMIFVEIAACVVIIISLFKNSLVYLYYTFFVEQIPCENEDQKILLNLSNSNSTLMKPKTTIETMRKQDADETVWGSVKNLSWQSWGDSKLF